MDVASLERDYYKAEALGSVYLFAQLVDPKLASPGYVFCARDSETNRVVGYTAALRGEAHGICLLGQLVNPAYRRQGIGLRLMKELTQTAMSDGYVFGTATISAQNQANITLYLNRLGWEINGWVKDKFGPSENRLYFRGSLEKIFHASVPENEMAFEGIRAQVSNDINTGKEFIVPLSGEFDFGKVDFNNYRGRLVVKTDPDSSHYFLRFEKAGVSMPEPTPSPYGLN